jgi:UDP-glucose 4-epimerase
VQRPATHVIPILCNKILNNEVFPLYGTDYPTKDGSCVRDYVHVSDLARAHVLALNLFNDRAANKTFNIGAGSGGISVKDLIRHAGDIVGVQPVVNQCARRSGDPAILVADITKAKELLNWEPKYNIKDAILHAWNWEKKFEASK